MRLVPWQRRPDPIMRLPTVRDRFVPLLHLAIGILAYGLLIPWLGFFWDDWPNAWFLHVLGPGGFPSAFAVDRPVIGFIYVLTTSLLGDEPFAWHAFALVCRVLSALAFWWVLRLAWPSHPRPALWASLLFLVYPSFQQQHIAIIYSHFFLLFALHFTSLALMILAVGSPSRRVLLTAGALATQAVSLFAFEYSISLEVLRPILLWVALARQPDSRSRLSRFLRSWAPYLALTGLYLFWRVAVLGFPTYEPRLLGNLASGEGAVFPNLGAVMAQDVIEILAVAWSRAVALPDPSVLGRRAMALVALAGLAAFAISLVALRKYRPASEEDPGLRETRRWSVRVAGIGLALMFAAGLTAWVTQLPIALGFPWDRLTLPLAVGASITLAALIRLVPRPAWRAAVVAVLVGIAVTAQVEAGFSFRRDWEAQRDFFWQLAWRAPAIRPGTVVFANDIPLAYESDNSLTGPLNWIYGDGVPSQGMAYMLYFVSLREGLGLPALEPDLPIDQRYRPTSFHGNTSQSLAILSKPPACLQVLDEVYHDSMPTIPPDLSRAVPLTDLDRIDPRGDPPTPILLDLFGPEPVHDWCYYFEMADLARQRGDWRTVAAIGDQALVTGKEPKDASEWLPFVEAGARTGDMGRAVALTDAAMEHNEAVRPMLCRTWSRVLEDLDDPSDRRQAEGVITGLGCD